MIAGAAEIVQAPDVSAGAKGALAGPEDNDPIDGAVGLPPVERAGDQAHHGEGERIQRFRTIEHDNAGAPASLDRRLCVWRRRRHAAATSETTASIAFATSPTEAMPSTSCRRPRSR